MFLNGITIVLCGYKGDVKGATIAWATKVERNHILVSLPVDAALTESVISKKNFSVNVLGQDQSRIARQYGGTKQSGSLPKLDSDLDYDLWSAPVIRNCRASFLCSSIQEIQIKEQIIVIAEIAEYEFAENIVPLTYEHGAYFE